VYKAKTAAILLWKADRKASFRHPRNGSKIHKQQQTLMHCRTEKEYREKRRSRRM
jgi:hypothetical protein